MADIEIKDLEILSIVGFDGKINNGLHVHPEGDYIIYPFGNTVTIQSLKTRRQDFLRGHTNLVSAVALSSTGKYVASGQINYMGFKAMIIVWDFASKTRLSDYEIHKVRVEYLIFTIEDRYLVSLGGRDDAQIVVYDLTSKEAICGAYGSGSSTGIAMTLAPTNTKSYCFLSAGDRTLRLWTVDSTRRKLSHVEVNFNKVKRIIHCLTVDPNDQVVYCGTSSGDVVKVSLGFRQEVEDFQETRSPIVLGVFGKRIQGKKKNEKTTECYSQGVTSISIVRQGLLMIAAGDGTVEEIKEVEAIQEPDKITRRVKEPTLPKLLKVRGHTVDSGVSSMRKIAGGFLIGTVQSEMFSIGLEKWQLKLLTTCHTSTIYDVCFPSDLSTVLATCSKDSVRVWSTETNQELLRIRVANITCSKVVFQFDGRGIITSWNDGKIRAFTPQTGKLMYTIHNAHNKGVSALDITKDDKTLVSGGGEGQVRVWDIGPNKQTLRAVLQEHKSPVSAIHINYANDEAASASTDGSCIIWDLLRCVRKNIIFSNTLFMAVRFHVSDCQILTTGTDRKISYWETFDGSLIRDIEGSGAAPVNTVDISPCGQFFVTGGNDQMIKLWRYEEGDVTHVGLGHAGIITQARFSPDGKYIVSVSSDGAMFRWRNPHYQAENKFTTPEKIVKEVETVRSEPGDIVKPTPTENIKN